MVGGRGGRQLGPNIGGRETGRGTAQDTDSVIGRVNQAPPAQPVVQAWEAAPVTEEQARDSNAVIPPALRPRVIFRYANARNLLVSGLVQGGDAIADHAAVIDVPMGEGHVVMFSNNPVYRGETRGDYSLVLNTILNFDHLNAGRKLDAR
jgi:hypothetical protein